MLDLREHHREHVGCQQVHDLLRRTQSTETSSNANENSKFSSIEMECTDWERFPGYGFCSRILSSWLQCKHNGRLRGLHYSIASFPSRSTTISKPIAAMLKPSRSQSSNHRPSISFDCRLLIITAKGEFIYTFVFYDDMTSMFFHELPTGLIESLEIVVCSLRVGNGWAQISTKDL